MKPTCVVLIVSVCGLIRVKCGSPTEIPAVLVDKCRFTNFCTQEASHVLEDPNTDPCCLPCSCSAKCGRFDRCCPDVDEKTKTSTVHPCRDLHAIRIKYQHTFFYPYRRPFDYKMSYSVIDDCPWEVLSQSEFSDRVSNCYNPTDVEDIRFVTGVASGLTYLNKKCAICNQEVNFTEWNMYLTNPYSLNSDLSDDLRFRRILESGVYPLPPSHATGLNTLCFLKSNKITKCNMTGRWDYYDKTIELKCNDIKLAYRNKGSNQGYANVYCFLCNSPKKEYANAQCRNINLDQHIFGFKASDIKFSALLLNSKRTVAEATVCDRNEIWDPFRMKCAYLLCPFGMFAQNGRCVQMVADVLDFIVDITIAFTPESHLNLKNVYSTELVSDLFDYYKRSLHVLCKPCQFDVYAQSTVVVMKARMITSRECSLTNIFESVSVFLVNSTIKVYLAKTKINVTSSNVMQKSNLGSLEYMGSHGTLHIKKCKYEVTDLVISSQTIYCPSITLTSSEMIDLSTNENVTAAIVSKSIQIDMVTVRICLKDYIAIYDKMQIKVRNTSPDVYSIPRILRLTLGQILVLACI